MDNQQKKALAAELESDLTVKHGMILPSSVLVKVLGYKSPEAFRQSLARKTVPIPVFRIPNRRGHYALAKDVAAWLVRCRASADSNTDNDSPQINNQ